MPKPEGSLSAVVVSGGKQYRVAPGDRILVDRLDADPGSDVTLDRVLLFADGDDLKIGAPLLDGVTVAARLLGHQRGPKIDVLRYKSKKRVRVHRGSRSDLSALEILEVGGKGRIEKPEKTARPKRKAVAPKPVPDVIPSEPVKADSGPSATAEPAVRKVSVKAAAPAKKAAPKASKPEEKTDHGS